MAGLTFLILFLLLIALTAIVCLSIATTIPVPLLVHLLITKGNIQFDEIRDVQPDMMVDVEMEEELA